jgi:hypothetical protein
MNRRECLHLLSGLAGAAWSVSEARAQAQEQFKEQLRPIPTIDPPDPNPKRPEFKLPPKSCDTHTHIFGPANRYPFAPNRPYNTADAPLETFRSLHEKIGVERCVIVNATVHGTTIASSPMQLRRAKGPTRASPTSRTRCPTRNWRRWTRAAFAAAASPSSSALAASAT